MEQEELRLNTVIRQIEEVRKIVLEYFLVKSNGGENEYILSEQKWERKD